MGREKIIITFIVPYYNRFKQLEKRTSDFFSMMYSYLYRNKDLQLIISDYGSDDNVKQINKNFPIFDYVYTEPNEGQYFNISKCNNNALMLAKNDIIFPTSMDWIYNYSFLDFTKKTFDILNDIIFEAPVAILDKKNEYKKFIHTSIFLKKHIIETGGWDERIYNWGQEDNDMKMSINFNQNIPLYTYTHKENCLYHVWHDNFYYRIDGEEGNKKNFSIRNENIITNRKNIVNSYWYKKNGVLVKK